MLVKTHYHYEDAPCFLMCHLPPIMSKINILER